MVQIHSPRPLPINPVTYRRQQSKRPPGKPPRAKRGSGYFNDPRIRQLEREALRAHCQNLSNNVEDLCRDQFFDHTPYDSLIVTAEQVGLLDHYFQLARFLQPSILVMEDVDLIARLRESMGSACEESLLNKLLNEMDGLREDAEVIFVLTTNRPEQLEVATASRPGRIDQAIEFPPGFNLTLGQDLPGARKSRYPALWQFGTVSRFNAIHTEAKQQFASHRWLQNVCLWAA